MLTPSLVLALTLAGQVRPAWSASTTQHFEIHYLPGVAGELDRVGRVAEQAYRDVSDRLQFVLPTRVPLVLFASSDRLSRDQIVEYAASDAVAPQRPHRSRIVLPLSDPDAPFEARLTHELAHLLFSEIILPGRGGDGGLPRWVHEGIALYMVGAWPDGQQQLLRAAAAAGAIPNLSELSNRGDFADASLHDALGHAAFDYVESRWGVASIRRFVGALIVPRESRTYDAVFDLTPAAFDAAFRRYVDRRFGPAR